MLMQLILRVDMLAASRWLHSLRSLFMQTPNCNQNRAIWSFLFAPSAKSGKCFCWMSFHFPSLYAVSYAFVRFSSNESVGIENESLWRFVLALITSFMMALAFSARQSEEKTEHSMGKLKAQSLLLFETDFPYKRKN
jgi:hypothetical protein